MMDATARPDHRPAVRDNPPTIADTGRGEKDSEATKTRACTCSYALRRVPERSMSISWSASVVPPTTRPDSKTSPMNRMGCPPGRFGRSLKGVITASRRPERAALNRSRPARLGSQIPATVYVPARQQRHHGTPPEQPAPPKCCRGPSTIGPMALPADKPRPKPAATVPHPI